jgi:hypothetical protein
MHCISSLNLNSSPLQTERHVLELSSRLSCTAEHNELERTALSHHVISRKTFQCPFCTMNLLNLWRAMMQVVVVRHCAAELRLHSFLSRSYAGAGVQRHASAALPPEKNQVPTLREARWTSGAVWTGVKNIEGLEIEYVCINIHIYVHILFQEILYSLRLSICTVCPTS